MDKIIELLERGLSKERHKAKPDAMEQVSVARWWRSWAMDLETNAKEALEAISSPHPEAREDAYEIGTPREFAERLAWMAVNGKPDLDQWENHIKFRDAALSSLQPEAREEDDFDAVLQTCADYCRLGTDGHLHMQRQPIEEALKRWALSRFAAKEGSNIKEPRINRALSILRNPYGIDLHEVREARLFVCDELEFFMDAYTNLSQYVESIGISATAVNPAAPATSEKPEEEKR